MTFSNNLRFLRKSYGYSQEFIAEKLGYKSFTTVNKSSNRLKLQDNKSVNIPVRRSIMSTKNCEQISRIPSISNSNNQPN